MVYTRGERSVAIVVEEILDIVDDDAAQHSQIDDSCLVGSTVLKDRVTELLDVRQVVLIADPAFFDDAAADAYADGDADNAHGGVGSEAQYSVRSAHDTLVGVSR